MQIVTKPNFRFIYLAVMRLGKRKEKEHPELKSQDVEGITRLICLSKGQNPLKGICKLLNHLLSLLVLT